MSIFHISGVSRIAIRFKWDNTRTAVLISTTQALPPSLAIHPIVSTSDAAQLYTAQLAHPHTTSHKPTHLYHPHTTYKHTKIFHVRRFVFALDVVDGMAADGVHLVL